MQQKLSLLSQLTVQNGLWPMLFWHSTCAVVLAQHLRRMRDMSAASEERVRSGASTKSGVGRVVEGLGIALQLTAARHVAAAEGRINPRLKH